MAGGAVLREPVLVSGRFVHMKIVAAPSAVTQTHLLLAGQENNRSQWKVKKVAS